MDSPRVTRSTEWIHTWVRLPSQSSEKAARSEAGQTPARPFISAYEVKPGDWTASSQMSVSASGSRRLNSG